MAEIAPPIDTTERDRKIQLGQDSCPAVVLHALREATKKVAQQMPSFTSDDILDASPLTPPEPRVMGSVMVWAKKHGLCRQTRSEITRHRTSHNRPKMIWRSNIFQGTS